jgi:uncharacterized protein YggT (Ycf19 family)
MELQPINNSGLQSDGYTHREKHEHKHDVIERFVWAIGSFLIAALAFRFVFALLGANPANGFASFINSFTAPLVSPFYDLFSYDHPSLGVSVFEGYTLVTIAIYGLATAGIARLLSITRY